MSNLVITARLYSTDSPPLPRNRGREGSAGVLPLQLLPSLRSCCSSGPRCSPIPASFSGGARAWNLLIVRLGADRPGKKKKNLERALGLEVISSIHFRSQIFDLSVSSSLFLYAILFVLLAGFKIYTVDFHLQCSILLGSYGQLFNWMRVCLIIQEGSP